MMRPPPTAALPAWAGRLQAQFGDALRTPLRARDHAWQAESNAYGSTLCAEIAPGPRLDSRARLAVYNRQYWLRLMRALEHDYPLTAHLLGAQRFGMLATRFLQLEPPRGYDLGDCCAGFDAFVSSTLNAELISQAARLDAAFRGLIRAPEQRPLRFDRALLERLSGARLVPSPSCVVVHEDWPLLQLRRQIVAGTMAAATTGLARHPDGRRYAAITRVDRRLSIVPVAAEQAELYALLSSLPLTAALAELERSCAPAQRDTLPERVQAWLSASTRLGLWAGVAS